MKSRMMQKENNAFSEKDEAMRKTVSVKLAHMALYASRLKRKPRYRPRIVPGVEALRRQYEKHMKRLSPDAIEHLKRNLTFTH